MPKYLSSDHDPLYRFKQWEANLRILEVAEIKTVPYVPLSHPFVERLIGTVRREYLDRTLFWTTVDLENKLLEFRDYFNSYRTHHSLEGKTPGRRNPDRSQIRKCSPYFRRTVSSRIGHRIISPDTGTDPRGLHQSERRCELVTGWQVDCHRRQ